VLPARAAPFRCLAPLLALLLLAFGLRVAGLESQSIWVDEGFSIDFSSKTAACMTEMWKARGGSSLVSDSQAPCSANDPLAIAVDIHPPLYYLLLHEWMPLAGRGEYAVRFPSVLLGLLLVLALYKLGSSVAGRLAGFASAAVGAAAPFYIAYSQEARMYAPVALFGAFSLYFTWRIALDQGPRATSRHWLWVGLVVSSVLALYTHYSAVLVIAAENILVAGVVLWRLFHRTPCTPRPAPYALFGRWAAAQLVQLAAFFPWLRTTIGQVASYNQNLWVPNWQHELTETFRAFDAGLWIQQAESLWLAVPVTAVLLAGAAAILLPGPRRLSTRHAALVFAAGTLAAETLLALAAFQIRPEFHPRYLMVLATPYYLLLGLALAALWRKRWAAGLLASGGLAAIFALGLWGYEFDPTFAKDDTRTLAQYLAGHTTARDVVILDAPEPLGYYYHGPAQLVYVAGDEQTAAAKLTDATAGKQRAVYVQWFLSTSDPEQLMPFLLQKYGRLVDDHTFRGYRERTYALPGSAAFEFTPTSQPASANFDGIFQLEGAGFGPSANGDPALLPKLGQPVALSGQQLLLSLKWRLLKPIDKDYKVTAYLTDDHGHLGGQVDLLLRRDQALTSRWQTGEEATDYYVMDTLPGLMPGKYGLNVAVYPKGGQERLSVLDAAGAPGGGSATIGTVDVLRPSAPVDLGAAGIPHPLQATVAPGVQLAGYDLASQTVSQGDPLHLALFWQVLARPPAGLKTTIALAPVPPGSPRAAQDSALSTQPTWSWSAAPAFPTASWQPGDAFREWEDPALPPDLPPGTYQLEVGMGGLLAPVGQVQVLERHRNFAAPEPEHPLAADLGGSIELLGYDQDQPSYKPGATAKITLYWRGAAPMSDSYTAFVHVLDPGRHVVSQVDAIPDGGRLPTTAWLPNEVVQDTYELPLKPSLAPGAYQLEVGFYRGDTGARLKASSPDVKAIDDGLLIGQLNVAP
jgi:hypothetical protein